MQLCSTTPTLSFFTKNRHKSIITQVRSKLFKQISFQLTHRSTSPSPNSSPIMTPRRQSTNDLRPPPPFQLSMSISPSHGNLGRNHIGNHLNMDEPMDGSCNNKRKVRSFLHIPSQVDMQEFWSGLRRPNRSPTIVITHELRIKESSSSLAQVPSSAAEEQRL